MKQDTRYVLYHLYELSSTVPMVDVMPFCIEHTKEGSEYWVGISSILFRSGVTPYRVQCGGEEWIENMETFQ